MFAQTIAVCSKQYDAYEPVSCDYANSCIKTQIHLRGF